jgi:hypothetical protein
MDTKTKFIVGFSLAAALLLFALAYNMGGSAQESADLRKLQNAKSLIEIQRQRFALCERDRKNSGTETSAQADAESLQKQTELLTKENTILEKTQEELAQNHARCIEDIAKEREERTGTREANASIVINRLEVENSYLREALASVNETKKKTRKNLRQLMTALRLENDELRRLIAENLLAPAPPLAAVPLATASPGIAATIAPAVGLGTTAPSYVAPTPSTAAPTTGPTAAPLTAAFTTAPVIVPSDTAAPATAAPQSAAPTDTSAATAPPA